VLRVNKIHFQLLTTELIYFSIALKTLLLAEDVRAIEELAILEEEVLNFI